MSRLAYFITIVFFSLTAAAELKVDDPHERKVLEIAAKLRCAVCQNESVAESRSELATDMRAIISEQLKSGQSEKQVIDYFKVRYGDYILMKPVKTGVGMPLWLVPVGALIVALAFVLIWMRRKSAQSVLAATPVREITEEEREMIERARQEGQD